MKELRCSDILQNAQPKTFRYAQHLISDPIAVFKVKLCRPMRSSDEGHGWRVESPIIELLLASPLLVQSTIVPVVIWYVSALLLNWNRSIDEGVIFRLTLPCSHPLRRLLFVLP